MDDVHIREGCQASRCHIYTCDSTRNHTEKNEAVDDVCKLIDTCTLDGYHKRTPQCSTCACEITIITWDAHSYEPDVHYEEIKHAPEDGSHCLFDSVPWVCDFSGDDGDMLT